MRKRTSKILFFVSYEKKFYYIKFSVMACFSKNFSSFQCHFNYSSIIRTFNYIENTSSFFLTYRICYSSLQCLDFSWYEIVLCSKNAKKNRENTLFCFICKKVLLHKIFCYGLFQPKFLFVSMSHAAAELHYKNLNDMFIFLDS